ncbi:imidazoleglycerol phosphate dehydratase HisB [Breznakia sp. PF5-3]|uniref:imidazoleglycerol-phosphate dehydratase HisB n=1 Tax=unclassified Breznakia TaxID=2623764 RepID=UPI002407565E|nr:MULTISPECIES: imidazoleglycerol-phosphate dehydratase HisB [unclassified Breznakia]MDF9825640.1 imidazoleglycerol phosphate dehydratase HisB [Breznakia sp. PM6-1]MDF9836478.1 imidazoleglycerol phosphate dehydratase HisB [Breznakia sp. PF5-3]MDF9838677.1 imidazoleglycerol phosphate dehydratase HisB [Breznakia sp. PFB2-8]MDF9860698.1 imidazoleglycerol phosphate dehydratase HisB [Breznakia sp. PH5-24]
MSRVKQSVRNTKETQIQAMLNLDGTGKADVETGIGFFDHMITLLSFHSGIDITLQAKGDLEVCDHHTIEDCGILLGQLFNEAIGDKAGIQRYGSMRMVMDETLCNVDLDISGRPYLVYNCDLKRDMIKDYACEMTKEFLYAFAINARITLHVNVIYGDNDHHKVESIFKGLGRALKTAIKVDGYEIPSSKGVIQ